MHIKFPMLIGDKTVEATANLCIQLSEVDGAQCYTASYINLTTTGATPMLAIAAMIDKLSN